MRRKVILLAGIGFVLGMVIGDGIAWFTTGSLGNAVLADRLGSEKGAFLLQTLLSGVLGAIAMGGTVLYDLERWPLTLVSVTHYLMIELTYIPVALALRWVSGWQQLLVMAGIQLVIYLVIWLVMYLRYKAQVREMNKLLQLSREKDGETGRSEYTP